MNRMRLLLLILSLTIPLAACGGAAQEPAPASQGAAGASPPPAPAPGPGMATASIGGKQVSVKYGRPQLKGRDMLGQLQDGQVWRFGQNDATIFETEADLRVGDTNVAAGAYSLFLKRVAGDTWHLIFNRQTGQWGTQHDTSQDVYDVPLKSGKADTPNETFTILLEGGESTGSLVASWDTLTLSLTLQAAGS